jgi:hypothetical protein
VPVNYRFGVIADDELGEFAGTGVRNGRVRDRDSTSDRAGTTQSRGCRVRMKVQTSVVSTPHSPTSQCSNASDLRTDLHCPKLISVGEWCRVPTTYRSKQFAAPDRSLQLSARNTVCCQGAPASNLPESGECAQSHLIHSRIVARCLSLRLRLARAGHKRHAYTVGRTRFGDVAPPLSGQKSRNAAKRASIAGCRLAQPVDGMLG